MTVLRHATAATLLSLLILAAPGTQAQASDTGPSLMEQGMQKFFEGLQKELAPGLDDIEAMLEELGPSLRRFLHDMGPAMTDIAREVEDWSLYEMPQVLPNGDILIRRKVDVPVAPQPPRSAPVAPGESIDL